MSSSSTRGAAGRDLDQQARPASQRRASAGAEDWLTCAVVFGILGGCAALWLFGLSPVIGAAAAVASAIAGVLFADA